MKREVEAAIFEVLAHQARRDILRLVTFGEGGASYTEILNELKLSTGRLNYHLKQLEGFIERNEQLRYSLTPLGRVAFDLMHSAGKDIPNDVQKYVKVRKPASLMLPLKFIAYVLMVTVSVPIYVVGTQLYLLIVEGGPLEMAVLLGIAMFIGIAVFVWIAYMVRSVPQYVKRLERRVYE